MKKLLWIGDAGCDSGFARVTHQVLGYLQPEWEISVLGINYRGDPHPYPYRIYPGHVFGCQDFLGLDRLSELLPTINPDIIIIQNDPWNFPKYFSVLEKCKVERETTIPVVGIIAVDGENCLGDVLNDLTLAIFWTEFGLCEARKGGFTGAGAVVPLGVDLEIYNPGDQLEARKSIGLPEELLDKFIVGNVNRNQPRKRLDLTVQYFAEWVSDYRSADAYLFVHVSPTGEFGYNLQHLMKYYGLKKRLIRSDPGVWRGIPEADLVTIYRSFNVQVTTTQGEGWGLPTMEGMACGIPQIVPAWSGLGEWAGDSAWQIPCHTTIATPGPFNAIGGIPDKMSFVKALDALYSDMHLRTEFSELGLDLVRQPRFRWSAIGTEILQRIRAISD
jgi:D-inositol-3-phosphate glycosyltransferase